MSFCSSDEGSSSYFTRSVKKRLIDNSQESTSNKRVPRLKKIPGNTSSASSNYTFESSLWKDTRDAFDDLFDNSQRNENDDKPSGTTTQINTDEVPESENTENTQQNKRSNIKTTYKISKLKTKKKTPLSKVKKIKTVKKKLKRPTYTVDIYDRRDSKEIPPPRPANNDKLLMNSTPNRKPIDLQNINYSDLSPITNNDSPFVSELRKFRYLFDPTFMNPPVLALRKCDSKLRSKYVKKMEELHLLQKQIIENSEFNNNDSHNNVQSITVRSSVDLQNISLSRIDCADTSNSTSIIDNFDAPKTPILSRVPSPRDNNTTNYNLSQSLQRDCISNNNNLSISFNIRNESSKNPLDRSEPNGDYELSQNTSSNSLNLIKNNISEHIFDDINSENTSTFQNRNIVIKPNTPVNNVYKHNLTNRLSVIDEISDDTRETLDVSNPSIFMGFNSPNKINESIINKVMTTENKTVLKHSQDNPKKNSDNVNELQIINSGRKLRNRIVKINNVTTAKKCIQFTSVDCEKEDNVPDLLENTTIRKTINPKHWRRSIKLKRKSFYCDAVDDRLANVLPIVPANLDLIDVESSTNSSTSKTISLFYNESPTKLRHSVSVSTGVKDNTTIPIQRRRSRTNSFADHLNISILREQTAINEKIDNFNARDYVLQRCKQTAPIDFGELYGDSELYSYTKIGEGVFGEVFKRKNLRSGHLTILKIVPIEGDKIVNDEQQKTFIEILDEIIIALELSNLRNDSDNKTDGFVEVFGIHCVQGIYPQHLINCWEEYVNTENDHPNCFDNEQLYIVFELANGGTDLEAFTFGNANQSLSAFYQIALTLAVAERKFQFEHRDLHWGNVLLLPTVDKHITYKLDGKSIVLPSNGIQVTIIDYTLSRMKCNGRCLYNDLSDFVQNATGDYQFEIYQLMRNELNNKWELYEPHTNILWLHYILLKMLGGVRYGKSKSAKHRNAITQFITLSNEFLDNKSAFQYAIDNFC